jgi:hypothetical protein
VQYNIQALRASAGAVDRRQTLEALRKQIAIDRFISNPHR